MAKPVAHRRLDSLKPDHHGKRAAAVDPLLTGNGGRKNGGGTRFVRCRKDAGDPRHCVGKCIRANQQRAACLRCRQGLQRDLVHHTKRAKGPAHQLRQVVAGDILHHLAA